MNIADFVEKLLLLLQSEEQPKIEEAKQLWDIIKNNPNLISIFREYHDRDSSKERQLYQRLVEMGVSNEAEIWSFRTGRPVEEAPEALKA